MYHKLFVFPFLTACILKNFGWQENHYFFQRCGSEIEKNLQNIWIKNKTRESLSMWQLANKNFFCANSIHIRRYFFQKLLKIKFQVICTSLLYLDFICNTTTSDLEKFTTYPYNRGTCLVAACLQVTGTPFQ